MDGVLIPIKIGTGSLAKEPPLSRFPPHVEVMWSDMIQEEGAYWLPLLPWLASLIWVLVGESHNSFVCIFAWGPPINP